MKKILAGCLLVAAVGMVGFGVAAYVAYRAIRPVIDSASTYMDQAAEVTRLGDDIKNKKPFGPPENGELTDSQVERFVAVQTRIRADLDGQWGLVEKKSAQIKAKADANRTDWTLTEFTSVFSDIANVYLAGRKAQVNALNIQRFSEAEYEWVRRRVYEAVGVQLAGGLDLSQIEALARENAGKNGIEIPAMELPEVPQTNIKLVRPHTAKLKGWLPMAVLGL